MSGESGVRLVVLGPPDLFVTTLVSALEAHGFAAEPILVPEPDRGAARDGPSGVLIVDIDALSTGGVIADAAGAGWTVLAVGAGADRAAAAAAVAAGAAGWVPKNAPFGTLLEMVRAAVAGHLRMSPEEHAAWVDVHRGEQDALLARVRLLEQLSPREREVLRHLADGRRAAEICGVLFVSIPTVRSHIRSILRKLGVNSQEQAIELYRETVRRLPRTSGVRSAQRGQVRWSRRRRRG